MGNLNSRCWNFLEMHKRTTPVGDYSAGKKTGLHKFVIYVNNPGRLWGLYWGSLPGYWITIETESAPHLTSPQHHYQPPGKCSRGSALRTNEMRANALGAYLWWAEIQIFFNSLPQIFLILEKSCKQKRFSCLDYIFIVDTG